MVLTEASSPLVSTADASVGGSMVVENRAVELNVEVVGVVAIMVRLGMEKADVVLARARPIAMVEYALFSIMVMECYCY